MCRSIPNHKRLRSSTTLPGILYSCSIVVDSCLLCAINVKTQGRLPPFTFARFLFGSRSGFFTPFNVYREQKLPREDGKNERESL